MTAGEDGTERTGEAQAIIEQLRKSLNEAGVADTNFVVDSREVKPGDVFVAYPGEHVDGRRFIAEAIAKGAAGVLWERAGFEWHDDWHVANSGIMSLKALSGTIAHIAYGKPSEKLWVVGVTGTNGKTSCSQWLAQALGMLGKKSAVIGTLGSGFTDALDHASRNTTPEATSLHRDLARFVREGAVAVAMEASSIGIAQGRLNSVGFDIALFTNLTRDHLDYHQDMQSYGAAKAALFEWPGLKHAVLNLDDGFGLQLAARLKGRLNRIGFCLEGPDLAAMSAQVDALLVAHNVVVSPAGVEFDIEAGSAGSVHAKSAMLGRFNVSNLLGVAATLVASGYSLAQIADVLPRLAPVPGRLQRLDAEAGICPLVVVDYAHTPDALEQVLTALADVARAAGGKLICVFGCGGDRDRGKRPVMGEIATRLADCVVITSDNPRGENPQNIIDDIQAGISGAARGRSFSEIDRRVAITRAINGAGATDVVLLAGKGHEDYQEVAGGRIPFSDIEVARELLTGGRNKSLAAVASSMLMVSEAARAIGGRHLGAESAFSSVGSDSRKIAQDELFVALRGERFEGHTFASAAMAHGAAAIMIDERAEAGQDFNGTSRIVVEDTLAGLARLGAFWRGKFSIPVLAVLGSNGKTTVKELLAAIMRAHHGGDHMLATQGNFNNEIGLPLTLLRLRPQHRCAVIEMGMNHPGEIARLAAITRPTLALINNAQREHQEFLHGVEDAARANGEVFAGMAPDAIAVLNADDACMNIWRTLAGGRRVISFALHQPADIRGIYLAREFGCDLEIITPGGAAATRLQLTGEHNARNALAAAAAAWGAGVKLDTIASALAGVAPVAGRLVRKTSSAGAVVIDDSYNANPDSVRAAIDVLAASSTPGILVLGDMGEVGDQGAAFHREIGAYAKTQGISALLALGDLMREAVGAFGAGAAHASSLADLLTMLAAHDRHGVTILVKGSRFMKMERVVAALVGAAAAGGAH